jgi:hypothetical protein
MIIDCHTHLAHPATMPDIFFDGWIENLRRAFPHDLAERHRQKIEARYRTGNSDPDGSIHVAEMDDAGIDVSVSLIIDFGIAFAAHFPPLETVFQMHRDLAARFPDRFLVFAGVDPRRGRSGLELFERSLTEWGFRGLKLYPPCGFAPGDERLFPYYELCAQHGVPVLTHVGPTTPSLSFKHTEPMAIDDAALRFPKVNFILGHAATVHRDDAALLAEYRPNVYLDMSGFQAELRRDTWNKSLAWFKARGLLRKIVFGTDWPIHRPHGSQRDWTDAARSGASDGPLSAAEVRWILEDNPRELLGL